MNGYLRQSTASQSRLIGAFIDETDFLSPLTGLTIANTDIKLRANGTTLANKNSGGGTHQVNGMYSVTWDATDTANVGELFYSVVVAGALPVFGSYVVLEEAVYDALFAASAPGYVANAAVNAAQIAGSTDAATRLSHGARGIVFGTVDSGASTASIPTSALDPAAGVTDQFKNGVLEFKADTTTVNLRAVRARVTASTAGGTLTVSPALPATPASGDVFVIH